MSALKHLLIVSLASIFSLIIECQNTYQEIFNSGLTCTTGRIQSPIELSDENSKYSQEHLITGVNYFSLTNLYVAFNERILKVFQSNVNNPNFGNTNYKKNGYLSQYELIDIEFYYPAEHRINVKGAVIIPDVEVKLIHKKNNLFSSSANENRNFTESNKYLIVSLLYKQNGTFSDNGFLSDLAFIYNPSKSPLVMKNIDLDNYNLIKNNRYYMYDGSFSYFPCDENVSYVVVKDIFSISPIDVNNISSRYVLKYANPSVNKAIAKPYGRPVYRNFVTVNSFFVQFKFLFAMILLFLF